MADLQVSIALALENQEELQRALQAAGGQAGEGFYKGLTPKAQQAFDEFVKQADKTAKEVGLRFSRTNLRFETISGGAVPKEVIEGLSRINKGFREAAQSADVFRAAVGATSKEAASNLNLLEAAVTGVAVSLTQQLSNAMIGGLAGLKGLIGGFMELDGELRLAAAAAGETGGYERLGTIVDKVGIEAAATTKQVAELATSLVRAGFSVSEVEKALPGVVRGAEATGTSLERMGDIVGNTLRGFGLEVDQTARVTDVLVNAANSSNASIEGLGYTFEYAAPLAKALGVSLEDVAAAAGLMANAGIQGSVAGTGLRFGLQKLQQAAGGASPEILGLSRNQDRLAAAMKKLGASVTDAKGDLLPLDQVFLRLKASLSELSRADQVRIMNILFGEEAGSKFLSITNQSTAAINKMFSDMKNSAGATNTARTAMAGFGLEVRQLEGTLKSIGNNVGGVLAAALRGPLQLANAAAGAISGLPTPIKATAGALVGMAGAATAASVGIGALNVVVGSIGGWAAMRAAIASVATVIAGPLGAGTVILFGLGAAAGVLTGHFKETDRTTKTLIQTAVGLGTFVAVLKGITTAQVAWNNASKAGAAIQILLTSLTPGGLAKVATAAALAAGAYYFMGKAITVTGEETTALTDKSKTLKDEITSLGQQIEQSKKLKIDTTDLEKVKAAKELDLQALENPLEIKLNIQKAEGQIKSLQEQRDKLGKDAPATASLDAQVKAAEKYRDVLKAAEEGVGSQGFAKLDAASQKFVKDQQEIKNKIQGLMEQKIKLSIDDTTGRDNIDKQITSLQSLANKNEIKFKAGIDTSKLQTELEVARAKLEQAQVPVSRGRFESNDNFSKREAEQKQKVAAYTQIVADLQTKLALASGQSADAAERQADAAGRQVQKEKDKLDALKANLEASKSKLENEQRGIDLGNRLMSLDKGRLETIRQMADAYMNMASAQAGFTQSQFDVKGARNNRDINVANEEIQAIRDSGQEMLQYMRDRGASQEQIAAKEREIADTIKSKENEIKDLKERGKQIEQEALAAAIEGAAKRFEMERKVLELKQMSMKLEQEGAVRAAERGVLEDKKGLAELQSKRLDSGLTDAQKSAIDEQIKLQQQSIELSNAQVVAEKERLGQLGQIFAMEKDTLALKQGTEANQFRAKAAEQGTEGTLKPQLDQLDQSKGKIGENKMAWDDVTKQADKVLNVINAHNKAIKEGTKSVGDLAKAYQGVKPATGNGGDGAGGGAGGNGGDGAGGGSGGNDAVQRGGQQPSSKQMEGAGWQKLAGAANTFFVNYVRKGFDAAGKEVSRNQWSEILTFDKKGNAVIQKYEDYLMNKDNPQLGMAGDPNARAQLQWLKGASSEIDKFGGKSKLAADEAKRLQDAYAKPNYDIIVNADTKGAESKLEAFDKKLNRNRDQINDQEWQIRLRSPLSGVGVDPKDSAPVIQGSTKPFEENLAKLKAEREGLLKERQSFVNDLQTYPNFSLKAQLDTAPAKKQLTAFDRENESAITELKFTGDTTDAFKQLDKYDKKVANINDRIAKNDFAERARIFDTATSANGLNDPKYKNIADGSGAYDVLNRRLQAEREGLLKEREGFINQINDPFRADFSLKPKLDTTGAEKDLGAFKQQESKDPIELSVKPAGFDSSAGLSSIRGPVQAFIDQLKTTDSFDQAINFKANGLDQIRNDLGFTSDALNAFSSDVTGVDQQLSSSFLNASNALLPISDQIRGIAEDFQNLNTGTDPFAAVGTSLGDAAASTDGINGSLQAAIQSAQGLDQALANNPGAEQLQQAYDSLQPPDVSQAVTDQALLADGTQGAVTATQGLADSWVGVADNIRAAVDALAAFNSPQAPARFAGGGVEAARSYTVNEIGPEAFLSATGTLSKIRAPQYGHWVAPSRGMVLPAGITANLDAMGAFDRGSSPPTKQIAAAVARPRGGSDAQLALVRLQRSIDRLEKTMGSYRPPTVEVHTPSNAGLLHTMQSFR